ncbi:hypothetical protein TrispH2_011646 [Trichoplax sp. H2]|nr:hypothetical protein TrispH2_011646 [Trichoplax sp. H2]|eukprot:RDD36345.1 hypothetical protein TrispH2_011646 [Trichoplax sp. H2]
MTIISLVGMTATIVHQFQNGQSIGQAAQAVTAIAYAGTALATAIYIFFFYYCIHGAVIFCKVPRKFLNNRFTSLSTMPVPLQEDAVAATGYVRNPAQVPSVNYN